MTFEENASDWIWETDADLKLQHTSPRLAQIAAKTTKELQGMPFAQLFKIDQSHAEEAVKVGSIWQAIENRHDIPQPYPADQHRRVRPAGGR